MYLLTHFLDGVFCVTKTLCVKNQLYFAYLKLVEEFTLFWPSFTSIAFNFEHWVVEMICKQFRKVLVNC